MKKLSLIVFVLLFVACKETPKDYVSLSGKIINSTSDSLTILKKGYSKNIAINEDGTFSDTLKVDPGTYTLYTSKEGTSIFLKNGYDLNITIDIEQFDETVTYKGEGAEGSNFLAQKALLQEKLFDIDMSVMDRAAFSNAMDNAKTKLTEYIDGAKDIDSTLLSTSKKEIEGSIQSYERYFDNVMSIREAFPKGSPSPTFEKYENYKGGTTSLSDLKGKYVYIDVWATWCGPCKVEIPHLKKIEADYHDKEIAFVSMSIDDDRTHKGSWEQANKDWRAMVADKQLGGIQIMAPKGWKSGFVQNFRIRGIPRFILLDKEGNVVSPDAPRPSNPNLRKMLDKLI